MGSMPIVVHLKKKKGNFSYDGVTSNDGLVTTSGSNISSWKDL